MGFGGAEKDGKPHYVVLGLVDGRAKRVAVTLGDERYQAALSSALLTRPVVIDRTGLAPSGRKLPREITLRLFAVAFERPEMPATRSLQPRIVVTLPNGESWSEKGPRFCISRRCGTPLPRLD